MSWIPNKANQLIFKCLKCDKSYEKKFSKNLRFANTYEFCNNNINKFCLTLRKVIYPYKYMDSWKRFDEDFYNNLSMEGIIFYDAGYIHAKGKWKKI